MNTRRALFVACLLGVVVASPLVVPVLAHGNIVNAVSQQVSDGRLLAESVYVLDDAWLVVHRDDDGAIGEPIGHTSVTPSELHTEVPVSIDEDVWAEWDGAQTIHLALHHDDGDGQFSPGDDEILSTQNITAVTTVVVERAADRAYVHAARIDRLSTNGSVTIRAAQLPADGFVVLESPSGDRAVGHTSLPAGAHEDVRVRIEEGYYREQSTRFRIRAVVYRDDGNGEFDDADAPVMAGNEPVATTVRLERTDDRTPTRGTATESHDHESDTHDHETDTHDHEADADGHEHDHETTPADGNPSPGETGGADGSGFGVALTILAVALAAFLAPRLDR